MPTPTDSSPAETTKQDLASQSEKESQDGPAERPRKVSSSEAVKGQDDEEWETIGYEETEEGRKAAAMVHGSFQIMRKKKRVFSYHWNIRKY
ncbi:hypothetical protein DL546_002506 [Coniochaeta pulveracea]|uniref:Uncharacterized protein n=1 Tax=Coniochaeta pulveracea TaxID=177199 RepID=A0A420Y4T9_9PEZI|nr:hypothetical protein DL546_002506 [Coniochaeta pulveracea]